MEQYISKSAVVAEIEKRINFNAKLNAHSRLDECNAILSFINNLEVKEVDLDKEINEHAGYMPQSEFSHDSEVLENIEWAKNEFRYFFELGMLVSSKAQKGE